MLKHGKTLDRTGYDPRPALVGSNIAAIPVGPDGRDGFSIVGPDDAHLADTKWFKHNNGYVSSGGDSRKYLHRVVVGARAGEEVDHINRNKFDNRRENLRIVSHSTNVYNSGIRKDNSTGFRGVYVDSERGGFIARTYKGGEQYSLGRFDTAEEAAAAYDQKSVELWGDGAYINGVII